MRRFSRPLVSAFCLGLSLLIVPTGVHASDGASKLRGDLARVVEQTDAATLIPVSVVLKDQLSGDRLRAIGASASDDAVRRAARVAALKDHARSTQVRVMSLLDRASREGRARTVRSLWLGNVVGAELTREEILRVAALDEVSHVNWNPKRDVTLGTKLCTAPPRLSRPLDILAPALGGNAPFGTDAEVECGVTTMRAPEVWSGLGNTGDGAVVAVIDSGVCWTHSDIVNQIWVNPGEDLDSDGAVMDADDQNGLDDDANGFVDDLIGWNFEVGSNSPDDTNSHGSHCAGTVAGDGTAGFQSGMAPDAKIMVVKVGLTFADEVDVWNAMQYAAENGADAISMSLGWPHNQNPDRATWRNNAENTIDLGTAMVIAAGNEGSGNEPDNVRTPGDVPRVITVGATDCSDVAAGFSSRGPVTWQDVPTFEDHPYPPGLVKPDVSAPGVDTRSHNVCSGYSYKSGTSMATPHVAGAVALMKSANAGLTHDDIKQILQDTAVDLGDAGKDNTYGAGRVDAYEAVLSSASPDGRIAIREQKVSCDDAITITVSDLDLQGQGSLVVQVDSATEPAGESVTLIETSATSAVFRGTIDVRTGSSASDGVLQIAAGETITATYVDADDGQGQTNVAKSDTALVDCTAPVISNVRDTAVGLTSARILWSTDEASDSLVVYGETIPPAIEKRGNAGTTAHQVDLSALANCTTYYYEVRSMDPQGNTASSDDGGRYYRFETLGDFGNGPVSCHAGMVVIDENVFSCQDTVTFRVSDLDVNLDAGAVETLVVAVTSTSEIDAESIVLTETGVNTSTFTGSIQTASGVAGGDGVLQVADGDVITVTYGDADDGTGAPAMSYDTATIDCQGPIVSDVRVEGQTNARATLRWTTSEPSKTRLFWGHTATLGESFEDAALKTSHAVTINQFTLCERAYFRIEAEDARGYTSVADELGSPFSFHSFDIPGLYWHDSFENGVNGWSLGGEWQIAAPLGSGGSSGRPDPLSAYNNDAVLGHDLTGLGAHPGDYEPSGTQSAYSPYLDGSTWTNTKLIYYKQLHSGPGDDALVNVWVGPGYTIYRSDRELVDDTLYGYTSFDLSALADGKPQVRFEFRQTASPEGQYAGWTVDDLIVKNGALPDYAACNTCASGPSFSGVVSAIDNDACGTGGVTVSWNPAASWGTGSDGSYAVYRGDAPDFAPGPATLVAAGIGGVSYIDQSAPTDHVSYYKVLAESDESCGSGPHNGGQLDDNTSVAAVSETTSSPLPGAVAGLDALLVGRAHVRLTWDGAVSAASYRILRSTTGQPGSFVSIGETTGTTFDDLDSGADGTTYFYEVLAQDACGNAGP